MGRVSTTTRLAEAETQQRLPDANVFCEVDTLSCRLDTC